MKTQTVRFDNGRGVELAGTLELPAVMEPRAWAIFVHCFTCTRNSRAAVETARALCREGIGVFRFDFEGLGQSEGDFSATNFSSNVDDLVAAAAFLTERYGAPKLLIGHSLGGAAVLSAAGRLPSVVAVATIGAPADPGHVTHLFGDQLEAIAHNGEAEVLLAGRSFVVQQQFIDDLKETKLCKATGQLDAALLVAHSPVDNTVGIENAAAIYPSAKHPKSFISLDSADHLLLDPRDARYVAAVVSAWVSRYIGEGCKGETKAVPAYPNVVTVRTENTGFLTEIRTGSHSMISDEPEAVGGTNRGPTPYDYLAAALGACTTMTLRMYADHKGWPLESVTAEVDHEKIHAKDCTDCESESGRVDKFTRRIRLNGPLSDEQQARLIEIAERCPVHRTLEGEIKVATERGA